MLEDQISAGEPGARLQESTQQRAGDGEGRVGDDAVALAGQAERTGVGLDDDDAVPETTAEGVRPSRVGLDGDDSRPGVEQRSGQRSGARTDVDDEDAAGDASLSDEQFGPASVESVPTPRAWRHHADAP